MNKLIVAALLVFLVACTAAPEEPFPTGAEVFDNDSVTWEAEDILEDELPEAPETPEELVQEPVEEPYFTVSAVEGDLIELSPEAIDPDGDKVTYAFTEPFDKKGRWQTNIGDEGRYYVAVEASDGKEETMETILVIVGRSNRPPVIDCTPVIVKEGEMIDLHDSCTISDEDDTEVVVTYSGWMSSWRYTTTYDDAGTHKVVITASDKRDNEILHIVKEEVLVTVKNVNRPPVFLDDFPSSITATENDVITLPTELIDDPDNDKVTVTFSDPFDNKGVWKTEIGDAGDYTIDVVASDGKTSEKRTVRISLALLNTAPVLKNIPDITVYEGETVVLPVSATDREGDPLTVTYTGWMTSDTYETGYDDAGEYTVKVSVTDGAFTTSQVVHITVEDMNRPPVFVTPA